MIRPLTFSVLLCISPIVLAQTLYKWVESDGSITFSVEPPSNGIDYETIEAGTPAVENAQQSAPVPQSDTDTSAQQSAPLVVSSEPDQRVAPQAGAMGDPRFTRNVTSAASSESRDLRAGSPSLGSALGSSGSNSDFQTKPTAMMSRKQQQCEDLKKRVVSLERRLTTRLTPEDMDNTVVHMARYQRSYDHHCVQ